ncbi:MAG TPA: MFS transporter [Myxococcales bacterium]|nr:MFS transporter [Myxococcales bacterium]
MGLLTKVGLGDLESRPPRERATFFFLVLMSTFLFMDQNLMAPNLTAIGEELVTSHQQVEERLAREDAEYRHLTGEWGKQQALVDELAAQVKAARAEVLAKTPALAADPAGLSEAVLALERGRLDAARVEALSAAARIKSTRDARSLAAFQLAVDDKLAGRAALWFWLLGGVTALLVGYLTDKVARKWLLLTTIVLGAAPCLATAFVKNVDQFVVLRALTGFGIGAVLPLTYSLIGDLFSARGRPVAVAWMGLATGIGIAVGQVFAGLAGPTLGWRVPFIAVAVPNLVLSVLFALTAKEPGRGSAETELKSALEHGAEYEERIKLEDLKTIFSNRTNLLVFFQGIPGSMPWGFFFTYLVDYYHANKGFSVEAATLLVSVFGVGAILGGFVGGLMGGRLYEKRTAYLPLICGIGVLGGLFPLMAVVNWSSAPVDPLAAALSALDQVKAGGAGIAGPAALGFVGALIATLPSSNVKAVLMNVNPPENRGTIFSLFNLADDLGKGVAPFLIGSVLSVRFGRVASYNIAMLMWLVCAVAWAALVFVFPKDVERLEATLRQRAAALESGRGAAGAAAPGSLAAGT